MRYDLNVRVLWNVRPVIVIPEGCTSTSTVPACGPSCESRANELFELKHSQLFSGASPEFYNSWCKRASLGKYLFFYKDKFLIIENFLTCSYKI